MPGQIGWIDLTVPDASAVRDFYQSVTGWTPSPVDMGGYQDFCMHPAGEAQPVAGICHARGHNEGLPPVWLVYITVDDLDHASAAAWNSTANCCVRRLAWDRAAVSV